MAGKGKRKSHLIPEGAVSKPHAGKGVEIDAKMVENLCGIGATIEELGAAFGMRGDSFLERVSKRPDLIEAMHIGRHKGKVTLRRMQWKGALAGNSTMLVWLGKQMLGQKDQHVIEHKDEERPDFSMLTSDQLAVLKEAALIMKRAAGSKVIEHQKILEAADDSGEPEEDDEAA